MIIVMKADVSSDSDEVRRIIDLAASYPGVSTELYEIQGSTRSLTEIYLLGSTGVIPTEPFEEFAGVERVVRVTEKYRAIGRHASGQHDEDRLAHAPSDKCEHDLSCLIK